MKLISNDFKQEEMIPRKFTCDGEDISPHLRWEEIPKNTKSFALSCTDPDSPRNWIHWYVCNIPADVNEIPQGGPVPGQEITNDFGKKPYGGPCPPGGVHRYFFRVYALDIAKLEELNKTNFMDIVESHTIKEAKLMGKYGR